MNPVPPVARLYVSVAFLSLALAFAAVGVAPPQP
jgi:hypothetical protein